MYNKRRLYNFQQQQEEDQEIPHHPQTQKALSYFFVFFPCKNKKRTRRL
ncbi:unnamed protein product [Amoebophrya sp. A25]|nr:unnamed protein product [Amoebophrya sp. A25]|eukprot:GSA25T00021554001.1